MYLPRMARTMRSEQPNDHESINPCIHMTGTLQVQVGKIHLTTPNHTCTHYHNTYSYNTYPKYPYHYPYHPHTPT